ncbi:ATP-binding protein [Flaviramulus sp. BrNp1-15]|uniref:ATP-binding protein n=1 Tax=Flaviramulus sp. BrNp1-15 TaxID=2916754 RepID=UPI001EE846AD|nr:ATP-binding protein [Flaviramulus sp. BrNp1-15]ULC59149.1 ATP-binding protein [Flaviramulus sp. BrNp1-15]
MFNNHSKKIVLLPVTSFIVTVLIVFTIWLIALNTYYKLLEEDTHQAGNLISKEFKNIIKADIARLQNLKNRIEFTDGAYLEHWEKDASMLIEQNQSFKFLEWIDSTMIIRKITPLRGNENAVNLDISKVEYRKEEWINHSKDSTLNVTPWAKLTQGGYAFLVDIPVYFQNNFQGTITGGMDFKNNFNKFASSLENQYSIELWDHNNTLFYDLNKNIKLKAKRDYIFKDSILVDALDNQKWQLNVSASNKLLLSQGRTISNIALIVGLVLCFLTSLLIYFYLRAKQGTYFALESNFKLLKTNEKLNKERNKAEKASSAKTEFLSNMSHEIRTPLHAILGFIELLKSSKLNKTDKEYLDLMGKSSSNLLGIVNDILDIEKIESGKIELTEVHFNPFEKIKELIEINQFIFIKKNLFLKGKFNNTHSKNVIGDESKLMQVVNNIVKNGLKFTNSGGVTLTYNEEIINEDQLKITISIKDTGIGIPKDRINNIFERFTQVENSIKKQYEGSGLGLTISKIFINMMGGEISVKSSPNKGTKFEFHVLFPLDKEQKTEITISNKKNINFSDLNVLVVDDNNLNIIVLKKFLEDIGITPDTALNGKIALEKFKEKTYQLIFMDIHMPEMDGWETTTEIRKINNEVIIFGLSANVTTEAIDKALESGMNNYLSKPFKKEHLYKLLHFHFSNS